MKAQIKYRVLARIDSNNYKRYRVYDLIKFCDYLDEHFTKWESFDVYVPGYDRVLESFSTDFRPRKPRIDNTLCNWTSPNRK